jgi:uncharacterized RDD family membrane protein YckC
MTSGPEPGTPGQWGGGPEGVEPGQQQWGGGPGGAAPGPQQRGGGAQGAAPGPQGGASQGGASHGGASHGGGPGQQWGSLPQVGAASPVPRRETKVTPRRVIQYIIDDILVGIVPGIIWWLVGDRGHGVWHAIGWLIAVVVALLIMIWYWVLRPYGHGGQTFGMQWLGLRIISKDGDRANKMQLVVRWILLIIDTLFIGLVGLITILCSHYRQRVGDHAAKTLVVRAHWQMSQADWAATGTAHAPVPDRMP